MPSTQPFAVYIEQNQEACIARLREAVAIPSVSGDARRRDDTHRMGHWLKDQLVKLGVQVEAVAMGPHTMDGAELELPPVLLGAYGSDPKKKTILVYGHYDVQPAFKADGWATEPFVLTEDKEKDCFYGRGSTDDKGPVLGWLNVIEAHQKTNTELPVNLKMVFEGMEESGSEGLEELVIAKSKTFLANVDAVCISGISPSSLRQLFVDQRANVVPVPDNYWLGVDHPCLTYGLRGLAYFKVSVSGGSADLHSGVFGGTIHEPMTDLISILSKLVSPAGKILVPGIDNLVAELTTQEKGLYDAMNITIPQLEDTVGSKTLISDDKSTALMARMRYPSLSIHGIEGAFSDAGAKTVIPGKVSGKFSIRLVPDLTPDNVEALVKPYLEAEFAKLGSKNKLTIETLHGGKPWMADINHWNYEAAKKATETVYGKTPDYTREGGSIPITLTFADALNKNVLLLPMGRANDGAHSTNEKIDRSNYIQGSILLGEYLHVVAQQA